MKLLLAFLLSTLSSGETLRGGTNIIIDPFMLKGQLVTEHGPSCECSSDCDAAKYCQRVLTYDKSTWTCEDKLENGIMCDVYYPEACASGRCNAALCVSLKEVSHRYIFSSVS